MGFRFRAVFLAGSVFVASTLSAHVSAQELAPGGSVGVKGFLSDDGGAPGMEARASKKKPKGFNGRYQGTVPIFQDTCGLYSTGQGSVNYKISQKGSAVILTTASGKSYGGTVTGKKSFRVSYFDEVSGYPMTLIVDMTSIAATSAKYQLQATIGFYNECVVVAAGKIKRK